MRNGRLSCWVAGAVALACSGCCGGGDAEGSGAVTFTNQTPYFVHFLHPEENVLYVEPGASVSIEVTTGAQVSVLVAPGQDAKGLVENYASCCSEGEDDTTLDCSSVIARWNSGTLSSVASTPNCPQGGGSCPYVYSGSDDVLEGESLVGALNRGAAREDATVLSRLSAEGGSYRVRIATELDETDHIDSAWLALWDHPVGTQIVKGTSGELYALGEPLAPRRVVDAEKRAVRGALDADDGAYWEGRHRDQTLDGKVRDWVELSFPRPAKGKRAMLVVRGRNTRLLQDAYHEYLAGFGPGIGKLMRLLTSQPGYRTRLDRYLAESGFSLDVAVEIDGVWKPMDAVRPVGPAKEQTIAVPLELPDGTSEELRVRLAMLPGAWLVDSARLSLDPEATVSVQRLAATEAAREPSVAGQTSGALLAAIASKDDDSAVRLVMGESLQLQFAEPPGATPPPGVERTAVLHVAGYYEERDRSPKPCVSWSRLYSASRQENSFAQHVLKRLSFQDEVDRHAEQTGIRSPR